MPISDLGSSALDLVRGLAQASEPRAVTERFQSYVEGLGFSSVLCFKVPEVGEPLEKCIYMSTRPQEWILHYIDQQYVHRDAMVQELRRANAPYAWSDVLRQRNLSRIEQKIQEERSVFGLREALMVPVYDAAGKIGAVSVAGDGELSPAVRTELALTSVYVHNRLASLCRPQPAQSRLLTPREVECLHWVAEGKSDWEIGQILEISAKTVNYHIENVKRKFEVGTRLQAIVAALRTGDLR